MLVLDDLRKKYRDVVALDGCSLSVRPGRMVGFLGPNGAGKTSAMRAVFGLLRLDGGDGDLAGAARCPVPTGAGSDTCPRPGGSTRA